jgi:type IV secretory pathway VirD2 relaxase
MRGVADVRAPRLGARRCIVKARIVRMGPHGVKAARAHLAYVERDGVDRDGSPGRLYGADDEFDRGSLSEPIRGERHQFRFIVSPEDDVDLTTFTRDLMSRVESDLGVRLRWGAANHYDTANPHAHVVVRGVDRRGHEVWIDRAYISERMRWRAQNLLTDELGPRLSSEVDRQLAREVTQERVTFLDRRIQSLAGPEQTLDMARLAHRCDDEDRRRLVGRLRKLETLQLAERAAPGCWRLRPDWQQGLRKLEERAEIVARIDRAIPERNRELTEIVTRLAEHDPIEGLVRAKGLHDELRGDMYAVIETARGQALYVQLDPTAADTVKTGEVVRLAVERQTWAKPIDRVLERVARDRGGVYDAKAHLSELRQRPIVVNGRTIAAEEVAAANLRRLERLERYRLVTRLDDGCWRVPPDLVRTLESRDLSHPRHVVRAQTLAPPLPELIGHRGPCWLDGQDPAAPRVYYGFGSALRSAIEQREKFVRSLGIAPEPREERMRALERLEHHDLARKLALDHGVAALASPPLGMRGQLLMLGGNTAREPVAYVLDMMNRRLALVPVPPDLSLVGRSVTVGLDRAGQPLVRRDGLGLER